MALFERVEELRKSKNISRRNLENELGFSNGSISKWKTNVPTPERLKKVADFFGVSIEYLLTEKDNTNFSSLSPKDERDITKDLDNFMKKIQNGDSSPLYYNGIEISDASISLLQNAIEFALKETKVENKVKYNPYKNKSR